MAHQGYGFCEFLTEEDAEYACKIMNQIKLWGKPIRVNKVRTVHKGAWCESNRFIVACYLHADFANNTPYTGLFGQETARRRSKPVHR